MERTRSAWVEARVASETRSPGSWGDFALRGGYFEFQDWKPLAAINFGGK
jgi:hypothetical protein